MTAEIVNLNKFKKQQNRDTRERQAQINRIKFGKSKVEKRRQEYESQRDAKELSGKNMNDETPEST